MLTGRYLSTPQIIRLQATCGGSSGDDFDSYFCDTRLPFGAKSSPEIFHRLTHAVRRMMGKRGFVNIIVYLDDFLVNGATQAESTHAHEVFPQLLQYLGFTISQRKLMPPSRTLSLLSVELDTASCGIALPQEKSHQSAAVLPAAGGYFRGDWFYFNFLLDHPACSCLHINHKETLAIILAATRWGHLWANHWVIIYSDKIRVQIINKATTNNEIIMQELRALFWL